MKIFLLGIIIFMSFSSNEYSHLIGKSITDDKIKAFLADLGPDYEYDDSYDAGNFYVYDNKGVELKFSKTDNLKAIFFKIDKVDLNINLPLKIEPTDMRKDIEENIGEPDRLQRGSSNLKAYYVNEGLVITYKNRDKMNMNNPITTISVEDVLSE